MALTKRTEADALKETAEALNEENLGGYEPSQETAVAVHQAAPPPATFGSGTQLYLSDKFNVIIPEFGMFTRIKAEQGSFSDDDRVDYGNELNVKVMSYSKYFIVTCGGENNPTTKALCKFSDDNVVLNDGSGTLVSDYIKSLVMKGYPKACSKEYYSLIAKINAPGKPFNGKMAEFQLSPVSRKNFMVFQFERAELHNDGEMPYNNETYGLVKLKAVKATMQGNNFTKIVFEAI